MKIVNPHAAGIDIGSRSHFVATEQSENQVKEFNVYKSGQQSLIAYLKQEGVKTFAMESTGSYWQSIFRELQLNGLEVILVSGHQTKNVRAKTDVKDCQWIQQLHALGLTLTIRFTKVSFKNLRLSNGMRTIGSVKQAVKIS